MSKQKHYKRNYILSITLILIFLIVGYSYKVVTWKPLASESQKASEAVIRNAIAHKFRISPRGFTVPPRGMMASHRFLYKEPNDLNDADFATIESLHLRGETLSDLILLEKLTNLKELELSKLRFPKTDIPIWIRALTKIGITNFSEICLYDLEPLQYLINLQRLTLTLTQVKNIEPLTSLTNLELLALECTAVEDITPIAGITNLKELYLTGTKIRDINTLKNLSKLEVIEIGATKIDNLKPISKLSSLKSLTFFSTNVSDIKPLENLKNLNIIDLRGTQVKDIKPLANLKNLEVVLLGGTEIIDIQPLLSLNKLNVLVLHGAKIKNITSLTNLKNLQELNIESYKNITNDQIEELEKALPNLKIIQ